MLLYFSATGNCKYIAKQIAKQTADVATSIMEVGNAISLKDGEPLGIVIPTYFWGLPSVVQEFFGKLSICNAQNSYVYCIATYGTTSGQTDYYLNKILQQKGISLSASYSIKTVDNYTVLFPVNNEEQIRQTLQSEALQTAQIAEQIKQRSKQFISKDKKSVFMCNNARLYYNLARKTKKFAVSDACIACGKCAKNCPTKAIQMQNGKPVWVAKQCTLCFGCLHNCPTNAINYGKKTKNKGQYAHPEFED